VPEKKMPSWHANPCRRCPVIKKRKGFIGLISESKSGNRIEKN
jgi:hypothetical protein